LTGPDTSNTPSPSPSSMPGRLASCTPGRSGRRTPAQWVVVETLSIDCGPSLILDGHYKRRFGNPNRASIAASAAQARCLVPLVQRCAANGHAELDELRLPSGDTVRMIASPVFGPGDRVYGVSVWAGTAFETPTPPPTIGALEWDAATVLATISPTLRGMLNIPDGELLSPATLPDLMTRFDGLGDRAGLLALLDPTHPVDSWIGTATTRFTQGTRRNLRIVAKAVPATNTVPALVCDISNTDPTPAADSVSAALRRAPIAQGHAVGIVDLANGLIHEWIADEPFASWRSRNPEIHPDDIQLVTDTCARLLSGTATLTISARIRFDQADDWIALQATWTRITDDDRPQALIDVTFLSH